MKTLNKKAATASKVATKPAIKHVVKLEVDNNVVEQLTLAINAEKSVLDYTRNAANYAVAQLDDAIDTVGARVNKVIQLYADLLDTASNTVRSNFTALLQLKAAGSQPLSFVYKDNSGKEHEVHTTAAEAAEMPKAMFQPAATALRAELGTGRKAGGGRKPQQPQAPQAPQAEQPAARLVSAAEVQALEAAEVAEMLKDVQFQAALVTAMLATNLRPEKVAETLRNMADLACPNKR